MAKMIPPIKLCASLACADLLHLGRDVDAIAAAGIDMIHIDVMDGTFVPNLALSADFVRAVRQVTDLPMDVHLMMVGPDRYIEMFAEAGANLIVVHQEPGHAAPDARVRLGRSRSPTDHDGQSWLHWAAAGA